MTKDKVRSTEEALKLALEALEEAWYHVGTFQPTEKAIDLYDEARTAIKEALMSGTDGAQPEHGWTPERIAGMARLKEAQDKKLAQPSVSVEQEPVACDGDFPEGFDASLGVPAQALRVANAIMCDVIGKREWDVPCTAQHVLSFAKKYTTPPQRKPLTDEEIRKANHHMVDGAYDYSFKQGVKWAEYKHGIKGEA